MARTTDPLKEQFWKAHISQAKYFDGSIKKYCQSEGIQVHTFQYWKKQLAKKSPEERLPGLSSFLPVNVVSPASTIHKSLPDPKWLAELICELHARLQ